MLSISAQKDGDDGRSPDKMLRATTLNNVGMMLKTYVFLKTSIASTYDCSPYSGGKLRRAWHAINKALRIEITHQVPSFGFIRVVASARRMMAQANTLDGGSIMCVTIAFMCAFCV